MTFKQFSRAQKAFSRFKWKQSWTNRFEGVHAGSPSFALIEPANVAYIHTVHARVFLVQDSVGCLPKENSPRTVEGKQSRTGQKRLFTALTKN